MLRRALADGPLPDDHNAAALWWRIAGHLSPAVATHLDSDHHLTTTWTTRLPELLGTDRAATLFESSWWPTLVAVVDHAIARGKRVEDLLTSYPDVGEDLDPCQALIWRICVLTDPPPTDEERASWPSFHHPHEHEPNPFWEDDDDTGQWTPTEDDWASIRALEEPEDLDHAPGAVVEEFDEQPADDHDVNAMLGWAARAREFAQPLPPTDREIDTQLARAYDADTAPITPQRILQLNQLALDYYTTRFPGSWAQTYLTDRTGFDLTGDPHVRPGYAPAGWTTLINHLRRHGATDLELTAVSYTHLTLPTNREV